MKIHQLSCLVSVSELGSVRMAALKLGRSPTAVSNALRELEREVGAVLMDRAPDGVVLNEAGRTLVSHAGLILRHVRQAQDEITTLLGQRAGRLSITVTPWVTAGLMGMAITAFRKRRPDIQVQISEHLGNEYPELRDGTVDLSIGPVPTRDQLQYLEVTPLFRHNHAVIARKGHPAEHATSWSELRGYDWIMTTGYREISPRVAELVRDDLQNGIQRVHYVDAGLACLSLLRTTDMLTLSPWPAVEMPGIRAIICALNLYEEDVPTTTCLITRKEDVLSSTVTTFLECFDEARINFEVSDDPIAKRIFSLVDTV